MRNATSGLDWQQEDEEVHLQHQKLQGDLEQGEASKARRRRGSSR